MKLALIGHGAMGVEHVRSLTTSGRVRLHTVVGASQEAAHAFASSYGFSRWTDDPLVAVTDPDIDIVVVASPNDLHAEHAMAAVRAGKNVLVEIPVATTLKDVEALADAADATNAVVMPAYTSRYYPALKPLFAGTNDSSTSPVHHVMASMGTDKRANTNQNGDVRDWVDDLVWHHGMHVFDVVLAAMAGDRVEGVRAGAGRRHPIHGGVMDVHALVRFASGAIATIGLTYHAAYQFTQYTFVRDDSFESFRQGSGGDIWVELMQGSTFQDMVREQDDGFLTAVQRRSAPPLSIRDTLPAARLAHLVSTNIHRHEADVDGVNEVEVLRKE